MIRSWHNIKIYHKNERFINDVLKNEEYGFLYEYPVVIDIGANIGTFSFYIYDKAKEVYAIEPAAENVETMRKTVKMNGLDKIKIAQLAISDSFGPKQMEMRGSAEGGAWRLDEAGTYTVVSTTLEAFMDDNGIEYADLVKIDIEGGEKAIFNLWSFPVDRVGTVIGELHNDDQFQAKKFFEKAGFKFMEYGDHFLARRL